MKHTLTLLTALLLAPLAGLHAAEPPANKPNIIVIPDRWWFHNHDDIQVAMDDWLRDYNRYRPHESLGLMTPDEFAGKAVDRRAYLVNLVAS